MPSSLPHFHCLRCHHTWMPRTEQVPNRCPACTTPHWNKEYSRIFRITDAVLERIRGCPYTICQHRFTRICEQLDIQFHEPSKVYKRKKTYYRHAREITLDTLPEGFRRVQ